MKTTVSKSDFRDAFHRMNRGVNFSYDGLGALYDFIEEMDEGCGTESELDVIAYCCEFTEYKSIEDYNTDYDTEHETQDDIAEHTMVIDIDGTSFIAQDH